MVKVESLERLENLLAKHAEELEKKETKVEELKKELIRKLEEAASLTSEEAEARLLELIETQAKARVAKVIKGVEEETAAKAQARAKDILVSAMQRSAVDYVPEYTITKVKLPDEDFKGRIIGKEGRNIKALEKATGVTFDMDETPGEVRLSSFDGVRREIARVALERLIADGRIQPARIETEVKKAKADLERELAKEGENLAFKAGVGGLPPEILPLLGHFKFRTSYGQNLIQHSLEMVNLGKILAEEVGADVELVKKACLLHDIGKVKTAEAEGPHASLTRKILEKSRFDEKLINAAAAHHQEEEFKSLEATLVHIADSISGARPGARFEDYEAYVKRMKDLEGVALSFEGVKEAYALAAGREIRVVVKPEKVDDTEVTLLSHKIAEKVEKEQTYPGQVKVTVIKEVKASDTAK